MCIEEFYVALLWFLSWEVFLVVAFVDRESFPGHFGPFRQVMRKIRREVTRKAGFGTLKR